MKKPLRGLITACVIIILCAAAGYFSMVFYYQKEFCVNTWINGVYCTGQSVKEVNEQLVAQTNVPKQLTIVGYNCIGEQTETVTWILSMDEIKYAMTYEPTLRDYLNKQDPWVWVDHLSTYHNHSILPSITYDEYVLLDKVNEILSGFDVKEDYYIEYSQEAGYVLHDSMHNRANKELILSTIKNAILTQMDTVNLIESGCYYDVELNETQKSDYELWAKIDAYQSNGPVYDFGQEPERISAAYMASFLEVSSINQMPFVDDKGCFIIKENCAQDWVDQMAQQYDTYGKTWEFVSTRGENLQIEGENYGTQMNREREAVWLEEYLRNLVSTGGSGKDEEGSEAMPRIPEYEKKAYNRSQELGNTYIEADFGAQKLYYYENGELLLETEIVTGNMRRGWDTPAGVNFVYNKQKNRVLRGQGYATPVKFWMPVDGAIGIHDADWRDEFGGEIYKTDGSHGCMNVPKEVMPKLYELVEIGTPVIMFYGTDPLTGETIEWS